MEPTDPYPIQLPFTGGGVNVYLFRSPEPVLIDAGHNSPAAWDALQRALTLHDLTPADLKRVIVTHPHVDHYGLAAKIAHAGDAEIWMADVGYRWLHDFPRLWGERIEYYRETLLPGMGLPAAARQETLAWMLATLEAWEPIPADRIVSFPSERSLALGGREWEVLYTPGHDRHLTCFYQPQTRQLLSADALMIPTATPVIGAPPAGEVRQSELLTMLHSLDRLAALEVEQVYPGHGAPFGDHRTVIRAQQARIYERAGECLRHLAAGAGTAAELFHLLYGPRAAQVGMAGLWMVAGYLDLLVAGGRALMTAEGALWRYRALPER